MSKGNRNQINDILSKKRISFFLFMLYMIRLYENIDFIFLVIEKDKLFPGAVI